MTTTLSVWDGEKEVPAEITMWDGAAEQTVTAIAVMPGGARSISRMLATPEFTIAHRTGRMDWAEYSRRAVTECMLRRVDALEISVALTRDGRWFGLHDRTLLRTSGVDIDPTTLTWAEVLTYPNQSPSGGDPRFGDQRYALLEDLVDPWPGVILLDPKYQGGEAARDDLLDLVEDLMPDARRRVAIKFSSGDATPVADWARSRGYQSWGHFRAADWTADPSTVRQQAAHWDMLGLDASAPQAMWDDLADLDRPLIGADIASTTDNALALDRGAIGTMIGPVRAIQGAPEI